MERLRAHTYRREYHAYDNIIVAVAENFFRNEAMIIYIVIYDDICVCVYVCIVRRAARRLTEWRTALSMRTHGTRYIMRLFHGENMFMTGCRHIH